MPVLPSGLWATAGLKSFDEQRRQSIIDLRKLTSYTPFLGGGGGGGIKRRRKNEALQR
jgi:hypothetical protein